LVAVLLILCVGVQLLEVSGRWDQNLEDANDEAGLVAIVLCVGTAIAAAGALLARICLPRVPSRSTVVRCVLPDIARSMPSSISTDRRFASLRI
jgi:hypothetical protein